MSPELDEKEILAPLARNLYVGYMAYFLGIRMATMERSYAKQVEEVGDSDVWLAIAGSVCDRMREILKEKQAARSARRNGRKQ